MKPFNHNTTAEFPKCPEGQHIARLVGLIDEGTQEIDFQGQIKKVPKLYLQFEVYAETEDGPVYDQEGKPFLIGADFTASLSPKGKLLPFINSWRGKALEEKDFPFDFSRMLDKCGLMTVVHNKSKDGTKTYANVSSMVPVPPKLAKDSTGKSLIPNAFRKPFFFDLDSEDWGAMLEIFGGLWERMRNTIERSPEFKARMGAEPSEKGAAEAFDEDPAF